MRSIVLSGFLLVTFTVVAQSAPPPVLPSKGVFQPFDLTYLPHPDVQGIIAARPAEIVRHLPPLPSSDHFRMLLGMLFGMFYDCDLQAAQPPALGDLDQCVGGFSVKFTTPFGEPRDIPLLGIALPCSFRTVKPFDWTGMARKWFPKAEKADHGGRTYLRIPCKLKLPSVGKDSEDNSAFGIFVPDDCTAVFAAESDIRELIDRLKAGKKLDLPPGWQDVSRDLIAIAFDQRKERCMKGKWPDEPAEAEPIGVLFETLQVAAFGLTVEEGPHGRVVARMVAMTKDADSAGRTAEAIKTLANTIRTAAATSDKAGPMADLSRMTNAMFDRATLTQEGQTVRGHIDVPFDLIKSFFETRQRESESPPQPPAPPPE